MSIIKDIKGSVATISLNRPDRHNAFDEAMIAELTSCFTKLADQPDVRVILLRGEGKSFCAGGDLDWMRRVADYDRTENRRDASALRAMLESVDQCPVPVLCWLHGAAYGGGVGLAAAADIVVADPSARFCLSEVKLGLAPAVIGPYVLRAMGARQARRYMLTAEVFDAAEAHRIGLVHRIGGAEDMTALIGLILKSGAQAVRATKQMIHALGEMPEREQAAYSVRLIADLRAAREGREGVQAFLEKRKPNWIIDQDVED